MGMRQCLGIWCPGLQGPQKGDPAPETDLGLGKSSEDGHQLLVFHVVSPAKRDVEDMDRLLMDILATKLPSQP